MKVAVVHPWFITNGGGEKVVEALARLYPQADFFGLMVSQEQIPPALQGRTIHSTFLDYVPGSSHYYKHLSPLYPIATHTLDVTGYDLVISSGGPAVKNVKISPYALHVHYCHSPVRFLWDQFPVWQARLPALARPLYRASCAYLRKWDYQAAQRVDAFIANSDYVAERIRRYYHRESTTIYPPVAVQAAYSPSPTGDYYLSVGRLVPHKRTDLVIEACNRLRRPLIIVGSGPEEAKLKAMAGSTVRFMGRVDDEALEAHFRSARAFVFAGDEDFGIATVEAQSYGLPVIALKSGGTLEIVDCAPEWDQPTGVLFGTQDCEAIVQAVHEFEAYEHRFDRQHIWQRSTRFSEAVFDARVVAFIDSLLHERRITVAAE
ncbi:MAG: glycosyltransferase [Sphingobium sp.]|uniref:glycosyltransferase n=1 Tax=Sphingobium sp. TaxID=1912891 RepID=UPI0029B14E90|nr:glycosyltransferase [Sphingobium sp.]MDX3909847.1 glycosyltransferase [Sphingobium sp.]